MMQASNAAEPTTNDADGRRAAVEAFLGAVDRADGEAVARCVAATNADETLLRPGLASAAAAVGGFDAAMTERFGAAAVAGRWSIAPRAPTTQASAVVADPSTVRLDDGTWRLTFAGVAALMRLRGVELHVPADEPLRRLTEMNAAITQVTADVRTGRYPTADAAAEAAKVAWADAERGAQAQ